MFLGEFKFHDKLFLLPSFPHLFFFLEGRRKELFFFLSSQANLTLLYPNCSKFRFTKPVNTREECLQRWGMTRQMEQEVGRGYNIPPAVVWHHAVSLSRLWGFCNLSEWKAQTSQIQIKLSITHEVPKYIYKNALLRYGTWYISNKRSWKPPSDCSFAYLWCSHSF